MMMWRRIIRAPVYIRVRRADHINWLILHIIHEPRRRWRAAVRDAVAIVSRLVMSTSMSIVLSRKVSCMDLWLFIVIVVARTLDDVGAVVGWAAQPARRQRSPAHELLHAGGGRLKELFWQLSTTQVLFVLVCIYNEDILLCLCMYRCYLVEILLIVFN